MNSTYEAIKLERWKTGIELFWKGSIITIIHVIVIIIISNIIIID